MTNGGFILAAYLAAILIMVGLVAWIVMSGRRLRGDLKKLEARGVRRRSAAPKETEKS